MDIWDELVVQLATVPDLPGARCRGRWELFDAGIEKHADAHYAREAAKKLCQVCPALHCCTAWIDSLPAHQRPVGVVAGRYITVAEAVNAQKGRVS